MVKSAMGQALNGGAGLVRSLAEGLLCAVSVYSVIPVPKVEWSRGSLKYMLCFFPVVGLLIAVLEALWFGLCADAGLSPALFAAVAALLPVAISGGAHISGLSRTTDALAVRVPPEKRLYIMSNYRIGVSGALAATGCLLLCFGLWHQIYSRPALIIIPATGFIASRALCALTIVTFHPADPDDDLHTFKEYGSIVTVSLCSLIICGVMLTLCVVVSFVWSMVTALATALLFILYRKLCTRGFRGDTSNTAGFFLQIQELLFLTIAAIGGIIG